MTAEERAQLDAFFQMRVEGDVRRGRWRGHFYQLTACMRGLQLVYNSVSRLLVDLPDTAEAAHSRTAGRLTQPHSTLVSTSPRGS